MPFLSLAVYLPVVECMKTRAMFSVVFWYSAVCVDPPKGLLIFIFLGCLLIFVSEVVSEIPSFVQFFTFGGGGGGGLNLTTLSTKERNGLVLLEILWGKMSWGSLY